MFGHTAQQPAKSQPDAGGTLSVPLYQGRAEYSAIVGQETLAQRR